MKRLSLVTVFAFSAALAVAQQPTVTEIAEAKPSADQITTSATAPVANAMALPSGTAIRMKMSNAISTSSKRGDRFTGRVIEAVSYQGKVIIPVGSTVEGDVLRTDAPRRIKGKPTIDLHPELVTLPTGEAFLISASVVDTDRPKALDVNQEGEIKGPGHDKSDLIIGGIATSLGAGIGALAGGGEGALIGAGIGATGSAVHWLIKKNEVMVPAGTELILELSRPMSMSPRAAVQ